MKYAFASFSAPGATLPELLDLAKRHGYDGVEIRTDSGHRHGVERGTDAAERAAIRDRFAASGIAPCCLSVSCRYANPDTRAMYVDQTHEAIDLAADIGTPIVRVFAGELPAGMAFDTALDAVGAALRSVAGHAAERGVILCVETHDDWSATGRMVALLRRVDHPAVACVWDVMHPVRAGGETMADAFAALAPWVRHVHMHDGSADMARKEFLPIGTGDLDHRVVVALLRDAGYTGYLSGEWIESWMPGWPPAEEYLPREVATMRQYEREAAR